MADTGEDERFVTASAPPLPTYDDYASTTTPSDFPSDTFIKSQHGAQMDSSELSPLPPGGASNTACAYSTAPPPSYDSIFGKVKAAKTATTRVASRPTRQMTRQLSRQVSEDSCNSLSTVCVICGLMVSLAVPISMIVMGAFGLHKCYIEPFIPIYLIVGGILGTLSVFYYCCEKLVKNGSDSDEEDSGLAGVSCCFYNLVQFGWFIAGNYWVYHIHTDVVFYKGLQYTPHDNSNYCEYYTYTYAFWLVTSVYICIGLFMCVFCVSACASSDETETPAPTSGESGTNIEPEVISA